MNHFDRQLAGFAKVFSFLFVLLLAGVVSGFMKPQYGGTVRIADDLGPALTQWMLFTSTSGELKTSYPFPFGVEQNVLTVDLSSLPPDKITEIEQAIDGLQNQSNSCHWILEYPYVQHPGANSIKIANKKLMLTVSDEEFLPQLAQSSCVIPKNISFLVPFSKTQFGFESNQKCIAGRPFLDSVSPVAIDPVNPYLAFKLNEVDAFVIPEERFRQISTDDQINIIPGPRFYLYLESKNISPEQMNAITASIHVQELSTAVLNDHAELYLSEKSTQKIAASKTPIYVKVPEETPYSLIGDRLKVQLESAGFVLRSEQPPLNVSTLELSVRATQESDLDFVRYALVKEKSENSAGDVTWFEKWDELQAAGKIVPLMLYQSRIAIRKNVLDVSPGRGGFPDFSNAWIASAP